MASCVSGLLRLITCSCLESGGSSAQPEWKPEDVICSGGNKNVYIGKFKGRTVAICTVRMKRKTDRERIKNEIEVFKKLGNHPYVINMEYSGIHDGEKFFAQEAVEPIGYDLNRLVNQYSWAQQPVPSSLTGKLFHQLAQALRHMHSKGVLHRDLKSENVLVTSSYDAKLIDMGIACEIGRRDLMQAGYMAPELCEGKPLGPPADCWGLGLILHQMYQFGWDLVRFSRPRQHGNSFRVDDSKMRPGMPSTVHPMEPVMQSAMKRLLELKPQDRFTLEQLLNSEWITKVAKRNVELQKSSNTQYLKTPESDSSQRRRKYLRRYRGCLPLTAYAVYIAEGNSKAKGRRIRELNIRRQSDGIVLLVAGPKGEVETCPGANTVLQADSWAYVGVHQTENQQENLQKAEAALKAAMFPDSKVNSCEARATDNRRRGVFLAFTLEFDSFVFPEHIGKSGACIGGEAASGGGGGAKLPGLNLRSAYGINLAGIVRESEEPEWFPGPEAVVRPGDVGLLVRQPANDGTTKPAYTDKALAGFMTKRS